MLQHHLLSLRATVSLKLMRIDNSKSSRSASRRLLKTWRRSQRQPMKTHSWLSWDQTRHRKSSWQMSSKAATCLAQIKAIYLSDRIRSESWVADITARKDRSHSIACSATIRQPLTCYHALLTRARQPHKIRQTVKKCSIKISTQWCNLRLQSRPTSHNDNRQATLRLHHVAEYQHLKQEH